MRKWRGAWVAQLVKRPTSAHRDLVVLEFEPCIGFCADSSDPGVCFRFYVSFSLCSSLTHTLSLSLKMKTLKKNLFSISEKMEAQKKSKLKTPCSGLATRETLSWACTEVVVSPKLQLARSSTARCLDHISTEYLRWWGASLCCGDLSKSWDPRWATHIWAARQPTRAMLPCVKRLYETNLIC